MGCMAPKVCGQMKSAFSYFNTATGAVHLVADLDRIEASLGPSAAITEARKVGSRWWIDPPDLSVVRPLFSDLVAPAQRDLIQHELRHVHQLLLYPYLYLRGLRALVTTGVVLDAVRDWGDVSLTVDRTVGAELPVFDSSDATVFAIKQSQYASASRYWFDLDGGTLMPTPVNLNNPGADYLTEQHLLEDEVAVYQYRLTAGPPDGARFAAWREQLPGDCPTFRFLRRAFDDRDAALRLLPLLVYWAYQTTIPMGTFVELISLLKARPFGLDLTNEFAVQLVLEDFISDRYPRPGSDFPYLGLAQNDPPVRLNSDFPTLRAAAFHPCDPHAAWLEAAGPPLLEMIYPSAEMAIELESRLPPPSIIVRIHDSTFGLGSVGFSLYPHPERFPKAHDGLPWRDVVLNLEYAYEATQVLLFGSGGLHACRHTECTARSGLCRNYPFSPRTWQQCLYPAWLRDATRHEVDLTDLIFRSV